MCGICGFIDISNDPQSDQIIRKMNDVLHHRGPDDDGYWSQRDLGIYFGHKRLSILDLSKNGSQPFQSSSGRYIIIFNGEIYNFQSIKKKINKSWKSNSDTEVLVECIDAYGLEKTLSMIKGMFAFALWDSYKKELVICRDRIGEKPLYYGFENNTFFFASELQSIAQHPKFQKKINFGALSKYFTNGYIPAPFSIYENIKKLIPGTYLKVSYKNLLEKNFHSIHPVSYWNYNDRFDQLNMNNRNLSEEDILHNLDSLLSDSIKMQSISDVPIGVFLSGGIDSSLVTSIMQNQSISPIKTFTIGFDDNDFDEAEYARDIAKYLNTDHHSLYIGNKDIIDSIDSISKVYDEPFADSSQIPTHLLCKMTKKHVTVSLSGDGGDELFYGYMRYSFTKEVWSKIKFIPRPLRLIIAKLIKHTPEKNLNLLFNWVKFVIQSYKNNNKSIGTLLKRSYTLFYARTDTELYKILISKWIEPNDFVLRQFSDEQSYGELHALPRKSYGIKNHMMSYDILSYLPDDILVKVDRAAMNVSLETRVPMLDVDVLEFAMQIPNNIKAKNNQKWILKELLKKYLPNDLIDRPKMGFGVPLKEWLRNELKDWASDLLSESRIKKQGLLNHKEVSKKLSQHLSGTHDWHAHLWQILIFQQWIEKE